MVASTMPHELPLPEPWASKGWKAKIFDLEGPEEPHLTVRFRALKWRISLRSGAFLDREPPGRDVPPAVVSHVHDNLPALVIAWDQMFPKNRVLSPEPEPEGVAGKPRTKKSKKRRQK